MEQASTGVKGKVKTEALKKEREAQVLMSPVFQNGISPGAIHMLIINNVKNCECRMLQNMKTGGLRMMLGAATVAIISFR